MGPKGPWQRRSFIHFNPLPDPDQLAVLYQCEPIVRLLLEMGAKPDFILKTGVLAGQSPLSYPKQRGLEDMLRLLLLYAQRE